MITVGFTGNQKGLSAAQREAFLEFLRTQREQHAGVFDDADPTLRSTLHHGDCVGADEAAHDVAVVLGWQTVIHPPTEPRLRAWCVGDIVLPERDYLTRNRDIVRAADVVVGAPRGYRNVTRSGTWSTIRHAVTRRKPTFLVLPDGEVEPAVRYLPDGETLLS